MNNDYILFYIWLSGFVFSLPIMIYWTNYKEPDGRTVVDLRKVLIVLLGAIIGNWGIVYLYLWAVGMWLIVKIGEFLSPLGDITFYQSGPPKKKKDTNSREEED